MFGNFTNSFIGAADVYFTGLSSDWTGNPTPCVSWMSTAGSTPTGIGNATNTQVLDDAAMPCANGYKLVCIQQ